MTSASPTADMNAAQNNAGITYYGRTYNEGKKVNWKDGAKALWYLFKFRFT